MIKYTNEPGLVLMHVPCIYVDPRDMSRRLVLLLVVIK